MFNYTLIRKAKLALLEQRAPAYFDLQFIRAMPPKHQSRCLEMLDASHSQLRQDLFGLSMLDFKENGFFVEFGGTDGVEWNNSLLMEQKFGWNGILAEPARQWHAELKKNRRATIDTRCVWKASGEHLDFTETPRGANSSITQFVKKRRQLRGTTYQVETITLNDLLEQHDAPAVVDFLSVDTEGSEFDILNAVDYDRWSFRVMVVEHNMAPQRQDIFKLLTSKGYRRVLEDVSRFDDWYMLDA